MTRRGTRAHSVSTSQPVSWLPIIFAQRTLHTFRVLESTTFGHICRRPLAAAKGRAATQLPELGKQPIYLLVGYRPARLLVCSSALTFIFSSPHLVPSRPIHPNQPTMFSLSTIPSITITPAADDSTTTAQQLPTPLIPATTSTFPTTSAANLSISSTRLARRHSTAAVLPLPPLAAAHDDRVSLAQCGMPVGSFKLNCVESIGALSPPRFNKRDISGQTSASVASARGMAVAKVFGWTTAGGAGELLNNNNMNSSSSGGLLSPRSQSRSRHTRAKSLNSLADLGIPTLLQPSPPPEASSRRSRYRSLGMDMNMNLGETKFSIDLAVLESTPSPSEQGPQFSFPRRS